MNTTKRFLLASSLAALAAVSASYADEIDQSIEVSQGGKVRFKTIDGDVSFFGWDKNEVKVSGELGSNVKDLVFENDGVETIIKIESDKNYYKRGGYWNESSGTKLDVYMPSSSKLYALSTSGDIDIQDLSGGLKAKNVSGDISISDSDKWIYAYTSSGDISLSKCDGEIHIESVSGDIDYDGDAPRFEATSISGDIEAEVGETERVTISSVSGDLELQAKLKDNGVFEATTVSGDIDMLFDQNKLNARLELSTGPGGDIRNKLTDEKVKDSWSGAEELDIKVGSGRATVELETMSGTILVAQK